MKNQYFGDVNDYRKYGLLTFCSYSLLRKSTKQLFTLQWYVAYTGGGSKFCLRSSRSLQNIAVDAE